MGDHLATSRNREPSQSTTAENGGMICMMRDGYRDWVSPSVRRDTSNIKIALRGRRSSRENGVGGQHFQPRIAQVHQLLVVRAVHVGFVRTHFQRPKRRRDDFRETGDRKIRKRLSNWQG